PACAPMHADHWRVADCISNRVANLQIGTRRHASILPSKGGPMKVTVVGDSVAWGQGLLDAHKYGSIVNQALGIATPPLMLAHSGATIGIRGATPFSAKSGEVPT